MTTSWRWIHCLAMLALCVFNAHAQDDEIERIVEKIRSASDGQTAHLAAAELVAIDSTAAARAFADELVRIEANLDRENDETLIPYLIALFGFTDTSDIRQSLVPTFERLLQTELADSERLYLRAGLARFGAQDEVQWLMAEYRRGPNLAYVARVGELLCRTNQDQAVRFVVEEALQSGDPTQKLVTEHCLRETGNPASLELMRRWRSVESGDFDLVVADYYLHSIIAFGDTSDLAFVEWLDSSAERLFGAESYESQLKPLIETARARINERR